MSDEAEPLESLRERLVAHLQSRQTRDFVDDQVRAFIERPNRFRSFERIRARWHQRINELEVEIRSLKVGEFDRLYERISQFLSSIRSIPTSRTGRP